MFASSSTYLILAVLHKLQFKRVSFFPAGSPDLGIEASKSDA
jgi:hypothetical protein